VSSWSVIGGGIPKGDSLNLLRLARNTCADQFLDESVLTANGKALADSSPRIINGLEAF
jgi:hypothetical protein